MSGRKKTILDDDVARARTQPRLPGYVLLDDGVPYADVNGRAYVKAFCPVCRTYHLHSWTGEREQHRAAHCHVEASPYLNGGYEIVYTPGEPPDHRCTNQRYKNACPACDIEAELREALNGGEAL